MTQSVCPGGDLGAELECVQTVVITRNADRGHLELPQLACEAETPQLRIAGEIADEQQHVIAGAVEERGVGVVPEEMHITDDADGGRLRGAAVHGTKRSGRSATREREATTS